MPDQLWLIFRSGSGSSISAAEGGVSAETAVIAAAGLQVPRRLEKGLCLPSGAEVCASAPAAAEAVD